MGAEPTAQTLAVPPDAIRHAVRERLTADDAASNVDPGSQREIANALVRIAHAAQLLGDEAAPAPPPAAASRAMDAGDDFSSAAVDRVAGSTRRILNAISFPRFVSELINGVFKAMLDTNQAQLQQYVELVRGVSQSLDGFASMGGGDDAAKRWLAERFPASYEIEAQDPDDRPDPDDDPEPLRLISRGSAPSADALRAALGVEPDTEMPGTSPSELIPFVRQSLARNRQQMLATMVQMGMQRIVIDAGRISAGMRFHIDASSAAAEQNTSAFDTRTSIGASGSVGFGWWSASASVNSTIGYVSTNDRRTSQDLNASADLTSSVELQFRTDQVPLDRIASENTVDRLRLNTLNPEREMEINREADEARLRTRSELATARASRAAPTVAPNPATSAPTAPSLDTNVIADRARAILGGGSTGGSGSGSGGSSGGSAGTPPPGDSSAPSPGAAAPATPPPTETAPATASPPASAPPPGGASSGAPPSGTSGGTGGDSAVVNRPPPPAPSR
ncbi:MAG: hypothetical protein U0S50_10880 [Sphingopyxis sp.]|uniref:hypothetical protein n=1 Tax=Sphingopyxis sp. TaxID=1908224 RepID=UPI002ABA3213|nr:hypothetical protein [Sphingopyxis sp.]MDZ3832310.1 hypothetical protein [Sphingopyxis sp.]